MGVLPDLASGLVASSQDAQSETASWMSTLPEPGEELGQLNQAHNTLAPTIPVRTHPRQKV